MQTVRKVHTACYYISEYCKNLQTSVCYDWWRHQAIDMWVCQCCGNTVPEGVTFQSHWHIIYISRGLCINPFTPTFFNHWHSLKTRYYTFNVLLVFFWFCIHKMFPVEESICFQFQPLWYSILIPLLRPLWLAHGWQGSFPHSPAVVPITVSSVHFCPSLSEADFFHTQ